MTEILAWTAIKTVQTVTKRVESGEKDSVKEEELEMANKGVIEKSNDFIGLHFPSVGAGFGVVLLIIVLALVLLCCGRRCWVWSSTPRHRRRRNERRTDESPRTSVEMSRTTYHPMPMQMPMQVQMPTYQPVSYSQMLGYQETRDREMEAFFRRLRQQLDRQEDQRRVGWNKSGCQHDGEKGANEGGMRCENSKDDQVEAGRFEEIGDIP